MDRSLLLQWLELPGGTWPPDPYTLLGLSEVNVDARQAEARTLVLMNRLRSHQLKHPELVTEGMNRLAEALLHVIAHQSRSVEKKPEPVAEVVETVDKPIELGPVIVRPIEALPAFRFPPFKTENRRRAYHDITRLRRLRICLKQLATTIGELSNKLNTPGDIFHYLDGMDQLEKALSSYKPANWSMGKLMPILTFLARQPHHLSIMRSLEIEQRQRFSAQWLQATQTLDQYYSDCRKQLNASRAKSANRRQPSGIIYRLFNWETILCLLWLLILILVVSQSFAER